MKKKPQVGDIWLWEALPPAYYLILREAEIGGKWWDAVELSSGTIEEIRLGRDWKFIS